MNSGYLWDVKFRGSRPIIKIWCIYRVTHYRWWNFSIIKKIFSNGQKKSPLLHIDQNMTQFIILKKNFFVPFKKVEFLFAFVAKQSFVEQNGAHFWHISSKTSWLAGIGLNLFVTHKIRNPDDPEKIRILWVTSNSS